ncbi:MAG: S9 family peptidase, partial [Alphaproteobacteria bacterium]|nr:S9 family peptidase [Alphaproteobacteria bacterium]
MLDDRDGVSDWYADASGVVRMGYEHDDDHHKDYLYYRHGKDTMFHTIDRVDLNAEKGLIQPFAFLAGGDDALVVGDDGNNHATVDERNLLTGGQVKRIYTAPTSSLSPIMADDGITLLGVNLGQDMGAHWFDPALDKLQAAFSRAVPDARVSILSMTADRTRMLVQISDADMPGMLYYFDTNDGSLHAIAKINELIGRQRVAPVKMISYKARDGLEEEAKLTLPSEDAKNRPVIMLPHGGPWARDGMDYDYWSQFLANRGYVVVQPNFRGSTGYGNAFEKRGEGELGKAMQDDVTDALDWVVKEGLADPKRAC